MLTAKRKRLNEVRVIQQKAAREVQRLRPLDHACRVKLAAHEEFELRNRVTPAMKREVAQLREAYGLEPGEQPGEGVGFTVAHRINQLESAIAGANDESAKLTAQDIAEVNAELKRLDKLMQAQLRILADCENEVYLLQDKIAIEEYEQRARGTWR